VHRTLRRGGVAGKEGQAMDWVGDLAYKGVVGDLPILEVGRCGTDANEMRNLFVARARGMYLPGVRRVGFWRD
jgi:hypothetical protein